MIVWHLFSGPWGCQTDCPRPTYLGLPQTLPIAPKQVRVLDLIILFSTGSTEHFGSIDRCKREEVPWEEDFFHNRGLSCGLWRISARPIREVPLQPEAHLGCKWFRSIMDHMQGGSWHTWSGRSHMHLPGIALGGEVIGREAVVCWGLKAIVKRSCRTRQIGEMPVSLQKISKLYWTSRNMRISPLPIPICLQRQSPPHSFFTTE